MQVWCSNFRVWRTWRFHGGGTIHELLLRWRRWLRWLPILGCEFWTWRWLT